LKIDFLRAVRNYLEQLDATTSRVSINSVLVKYYTISKEIINYIEEKFNPLIKDREYKKIKESLLKHLDSVESINEDKILRYYIEIIENIIRCNLYVKQRKTIYLLKSIVDIYHL